MWDSQVGAVADIANPLPLDLDADETVGDAADRVLAIAPARFALVGFSMGGYVAFEIWRRAPGRVRRLALLSTSARADDCERLTSRQTQIDRVESGEYQQLIDELAPLVVHPDGPMSSQVISEIRRMATEIGPQAFIRQLRICMSRADSRVDLGQVDCPTLVVCGRNDTLTPPALSREMAESIPAARLELIDCCRHYSPMEQPQTMNQLLRDWLSDD